MVMNISVPSYFTVSDSPMLSSLALFVNWRGYLSTPSQLYTFSHYASNISKGIWGETLNVSLLGLFSSYNHKTPYIGLKWTSLRILAFSYVIFTSYAEAFILQSVCVVLTWSIYRASLRSFLTFPVLFSFSHHVRNRMQNNGRVGWINHNAFTHLIRFLEEFVIVFLMLSGFHSLVSIQFGHAPFILTLVATLLNFHFMVIFLFKHTKSYIRWNCLSFFIVWIGLLYTHLYPTGMVAILGIVISMFLFLIMMYVFTMVEVPEDDFEIDLRRRREELEVQQQEETVGNELEEFPFDPDGDGDNNNDNNININDGDEDGDSDDNEQIQIVADDDHALHEHVD
jgi:hypothetical protein